MSLLHDFHHRQDKKGNCKRNFYFQDKKRWPLNRGDRMGRCTVFSVFLVSSTFLLFLGSICSLIKVISCSVKPYLSNSPFRLQLVNKWSNIFTDISSCWNIITVLLFILLIQDQLLPFFWEVVPSEMHLAQDITWFQKTVYIFYFISIYSC